MPRICSGELLCDIAGLLGPPLLGVFRPPRTAATALANILKASDRLREALLRCSASTADTCSAGSPPGTPTRTRTLTLTLALALTLTPTLTLTLTPT